MRLFKSSTQTAPPPSAKTITDLPLELILKILQQLSSNDIIRCKRSCRKLFNVSEKYSGSLERPWVRMDFTAALKFGTPMVLVKFCRTNSKQGAPYIFGVYEVDGKIELGWTKGEAPKKIILNGKGIDKIMRKKAGGNVRIRSHPRLPLDFISEPSSNKLMLSESCTRLGNKYLALPAQISKQFTEEATTMTDTIQRLLRAHLNKVHVKELNFLDPCYKDIVSFTKCRELAVKANKETVDLLKLNLPKILVYGEAGITVDVLIIFIEQWEAAKRQISEFRWISDLEFTEIRSRLRALRSFVNEESSRTFLCRACDRQRIVINIEHNSLQMYTK